MFSYREIANAACLFNIICTKYHNTIYKSVLLKFDKFEFIELFIYYYTKTFHIRTGVAE